jgi:hypothetical protein
VRRDYGRQSSREDVQAALTQLKRWHDAKTRLHIHVVHGCFAFASLGTICQVQGAFALIEQQGRPGVLTLSIEDSICTVRNEPGETEITFLHTISRTLLYISEKKITPEDIFARFPPKNTIVQ